MADEPDNLVLELLRAMRADQAETNARLDGLAADQAAMRTEVNAKVDRVIAAQILTDAKIDQVLDRVNDVMAGVVRLKTDAENQDIGQLRREVASLDARVSALERQRS